MQGYYDNTEHHPVQDTAGTMDLKKEGGDDLDLIEHTISLDVDKMNREKIDADCHLWDALESSKWLPMETLEVS
ncbi:unnamed protein product [Acanthoscelides obtectus]|uniref:Uncharacterized protein n=1 Tax=Acanthoscelides obtectus TaxID=200917 RepID=A0A9P0Q3R2_ACAOB|nr:unnamed protein product [Acanthoscelides obtectus]CAH2007773.1 unnamed protein product [Acanthoscelides obtectus]CAK1643929.1 hypothetical protein AOBTE_LOCUS13727 [Acanthoscelides obtectus]CAK1643931.1 hypothetical protein AOBTE_LOCUS13728 [Acanthoscelides obtectus]